MKKINKKFTFSQSEQRKYMVILKYVTQSCCIQEIESFHTIIAKYSSQKNTFKNIIRFLNNTFKKKYVKLHGWPSNQVQQLSARRMYFERVQGYRFNPDFRTHIQYISKILKKGQHILLLQEVFDSTTIYSYNF